MAKKKRDSITAEVAAKIQFLSDRTCCVCNEKGKTIQIHHIDEDPSNNNIENLAVLCLECHNNTMINGGFGRKLNASQIILFRDAWIERVKVRREKADELASIKAVTGFSVNVTAMDDSGNNYVTHDDPTILKEYIEKIIPVQQQAQLTLAQTRWDTGITAKMNKGTYDMIDFYEEVLIELSSFYPYGHFNNQNPKDYFNDVISSKFLWYRLMQEPSGVGTGGSMTTCIIGANVLDAVKEMVVTMIESLLQFYDLESQIDFNKWRDNWYA